MFKPVFVYSSKNPSPILEIARSKGFRLVDIEEVGTSVHGGNPGVVVYDQSADAWSIHEKSGSDRFLPPKHTAVVIFHRNGKGHIRGLPDPLGFLKRFTGKDVQKYWRITGNFRMWHPMD